MVREFRYRGKSLQELQQMEMKELANYLSARARRILLNKGFSEEQKKLLAKLKEMKEGKIKKVRTHRRDMLILPSMVGLTINVHSGKSFEPVLIYPEMIGSKLGDYVITTKFDVKHSGPGVGATKGSKAQSVK